MDKSLKGLVLAGGRSTRMGVDKATIKWHGKEQQYHLANLLANYCEEVFISCREDQADHIAKNYKTLPDQYLESGPYEAILTAFQKYTDFAWMVIACDVPLIDQQTLQFLNDERDIKKIATTFESQWDGLPEPLTAIWEAESYALLKAYHQKEQTSLRKILIEHGAKIIKAPEAGALINANTPDDAKRIYKILQEKKTKLRT